MKKIICFVSLIMVVALAGCSKGNEVVDNTDVQNVDVSQTEQVHTAEISDSKLINIIKDENNNAVISESLNPGQTMLKIELPIFEETDEKAEEFFEEVEDIIEDIKLHTGSEYDFYYFSTSENDAVVMSVAFKRDNDKLVLDSVNGIGEAYKNAPEIAKTVSPIFVLAE